MLVYRLEQFSRYENLFQSREFTCRTSAWTCYNSIILCCHFFQGLKRVRHSRNMAINYILPLWNTHIHRERPSACYLHPWSSHLFDRRSLSSHDGFVVLPPRAFLGQVLENQTLLLHRIPDSRHSLWHGHNMPEAWGKQVRHRGKDGEGVQMGECWGYR